MSDIVDQKTFRDVSANLKLLAKLTKGDKLNTGGLQISKPSFFRPVIRFLSHETGVKTYDFILNIVDTIPRLLTNEHITLDQRKLLLQDIQTASNGIDNIRQTYEPEDDILSCRIRTLQQQLESVLKRYDNIDQ